MSCQAMISPWARVQGEPVMATREGVDSSPEDTYNLLTFTLSMLMLPRG